MLPEHLPELGGEGVGQHALQPVPLNPALPPSQYTSKGTPSSSSNSVSACRVSSGRQLRYSHSPVCTSSTAAPLDSTA